MLIKMPAVGDCSESQVTPEKAYLGRRQVL